MISALRMEYTNQAQKQWSITLECKVKPTNRLEER